MEFSLEQLEAFAAAADTGSFSAAGRRLGKAQSAVSTAVANLEADLGVELFDRSGKYPLPTDEGVALLRDVRGVLERCAALRERAWAWAAGGGGVVRLAVDEVVPHELFTDVLMEFAGQFPEVELEVLYGVLGDVTRMVEEGRAELGLLVPHAYGPRTVSHRLAGHLKFRPYAGSGHPLSALRSVGTDDLALHRQMLITSRGGESDDEETIFSPRVWRLESTHIIRDLVVRGLGWSFLPVHLAEADVKAGRLVELPVTGVAMEHPVPVYILHGHASSASPGANAASSWLAEALARVAGGG